MRIPLCNTTYAVYLFLLSFPVGFAWTILPRNISPFTNLTYVLYTKMVKSQFLGGMEQTDIKFSMKLSKLTPLQKNALLIFELQKEAVAKDFNKPGISKVLQLNNDIYQRCENPYARRTQMEKIFDLTFKHTIHNKI